MLHSMHLQSQHVNYRSLSCCQQMSLIGPSAAGPLLTCSGKCYESASPFLRAQHRSKAQSRSASPPLHAYQHYNTRCAWDNRVWVAGCLHEVSSCCCLLCLRRLGMLHALLQVADVVVITAAMAAQSCTCAVFDKYTLKCWQMCSNG
jgi:hypothetical protein